MLFMFLVKKFISEQGNRIVSERTGKVNANMIALIADGMTKASRTGRW